MRRHLDEHVVAGLGECGHGRVEQHRLGEVGRPVLGVQPVALDGPPGDGGDHGDGAGARSQVRQPPPQLLRDGLHQRAVGGEFDRLQDPAVDAVGLQRLGEGLKGGALTGEHGGAGAVGCRDPHRPGASFGEDLAGPVQGDAGDGHPALAGGGVQGGPAVQRDDEGVLQGDRARQVRRGDLADAVADGGGRFDAPGAPQGGERDLDGGESRLADGGVQQPGPVGVGGELVEQGPVGVPAQQGVAAFDDRAEHRLPVEQVAGQRPPARALPGEDEHRLGAPAHPPDAGGQAGRLLAAAERGERGAQFVRRGAGAGQPVLVVGAADRRGGGEVGQDQAGRRELVGMGGGEVAQGLFVARGDGQQDGAVLGVRPGRGGGGGRLLQHQVGVGAAETEGADAGQGRSVRTGRPRLEGVGDPQREVVEGDVRIRLAVVQGRRHGAVADHQRGLDQAADARGGLHVPEVGLHRADQARQGGVAAVTEDRAERLGLDRVAEDRAGAVGLDVTDRPRPARRPCGGRRAAPLPGPADWAPSGRCSRRPG